MQRKIEPTGRGLKLEDGLEILSWDESSRTLFEKAILASYEQTLDCPGLLGLRKIEDIIEGHMSTGKFVPGLWHVLHRRGEAVGVLLLNLLPPRQAVELVYLGLAPRWRKKGVARRLLEYGMELGTRFNAKTMVCAVDEDNTPAVSLYRRLQFTPSGQKVAMILGLDQATQ